MSLALIHDALDSDGLLDKEKYNSSSLDGQAEWQKNVNTTTLYAALHYLPKKPRFFEIDPEI